jgi:predicted nucleic acid-binding Zn ribbon protein
MFCKACGAAIPDDAKFCPKCGAAAHPALAAPAAAPAPKPAAPAAAGSLNLEDPKTQAEIACGLTALLMFIFGLIGIANGGSAYAYVFGFLDIALGACAAQAIVFSRKRQFPQAKQMAGIAALGLVVVGILSVVLFGSGTSLVICLLLAAATGFAYWRFSQLG